MPSRESDLWSCDPGLLLPALWVYEQLDSFARPSAHEILCSWSRRDRPQETWKVKVHRQDAVFDEGCAQERQYWPNVSLPTGWKESLSGQARYQPMLSQTLLLLLRPATLMSAKHCAHSRCWLLYWKYCWDRDWLTRMSTLTEARNIKWLHRSDDGRE